MTLITIGTTNDYNDYEEMFNIINTEYKNSNTQLEILLTYPKKKNVSKLIHIICEDLKIKVTDFKLTWTERSLVKNIANLNIKIINILKYNRIYNFYDCKVIILTKYPSFTSLVLENEAENISEFIKIIYI